MQISAKFLYISLLLGTLYLIFQITFRLFQSEKELENIRSVWELVPSEAGLVLEVTSLPSLIQQLDTIPYWEDLQEIPPIENLAEKIKYFSECSAPLVTKTPKESTLLVAIPISLHKWGLLIILPLPSNYVLEKDTSSLLLTPDSERREFRRHIVYETALKENEQMTFTQLGNYLLMSFSAQTVELAIRQQLEANFSKKDVPSLTTGTTLHVNFPICLDWWKKSVSSMHPHYFERWKVLPRLRFNTRLTKNTILLESTENTFFSYTWEETLQNALQLLPYFPEEWKNDFPAQRTVLKHFETLRLHVSPQRCKITCTYNLEKASLLTKIKLLKDLWWSGNIQKLVFIPTKEGTLVLLLDEKGIHAFTPYGLLEKKPLKWQLLLNDSLIEWKQVIKKAEHLWIASRRKIYKVSTKGVLLKTYSPIVQPVRFIEVFQDIHQRTFFMVVDEKCTATLYDEEGNVLPQWNKKSLFRLPHHPPLYVNLGKEEGIFVFSAEGWIHFFRLNGTSYPNFPLLLQEYLTPYCFIERGKDLNSSIATLLTVQGELLKLRLSGELIERKKLHYPIGEATFHLVREELRQDKWLLVCQEEDQFLVFEEKNASSEPRKFKSFSNAVFQYFSGTSQEEELLVLTDTTTQETFLWKHHEGQLTWYPLKNSFPVWMLEEKQRWLLVGASPHHLRIWSVSK